MNKEVLKEFRKSPEDFLKEIRSQNVFFSALADINGAPDPMDIADPASSHRDREFIHFIRHRNHQLIREISALLRRIEDGSFGICDECLGSIETERLRAQPAAALCINCQWVRERKNRATAA
ncbi:MAG: TraR/DksA family transcriptional regulator [Syntrophobacteraceae bacterium]|jgi:DnaK suppressor protein